jgi:hypothetical protein
MPPKRLNPKKKKRDRPVIRKNSNKYQSIEEFERRAEEWRNGPIAKRYDELVEEWEKNNPHLHSGKCSHEGSCGFAPALREHALSLLMIQAEEEVKRQHEKVETNVL